MKKVIAIVCGILGCLLFLVSILLAVLGGYLGFSEFDRQKPAFPDTVQDAYFVDTLTIDRPVVTKIAEEYYILPETTVEKYDGCDSSFIARPDVILFSTDWLLGFPFDIYAVGFMGGNLCFEPDGERNGLPVFQFDYPPKDFILALVRKHEWVCVDWPDVWEARFFKDYQLVLNPRFEKRHEKALFKARAEEVRQAMQGYCE